MPARAFRRPRTDSRRYTLTSYEQVLQKKSWHTLAALKDTLNRLQDAPDKAAEAYGTVRQQQQLKAFWLRTRVY